MKKALLLLIAASLLFSPVLGLHSAEAQTKQQVNTITKKYGVYIGVVAALGTAATVCAIIPGGSTVAGTGVTAPRGDFCQAFHDAGESIAYLAYDYGGKIIEYMAKYALNVIKQRVLSMLTDQIVTWIQGGGKGSPKFVTNWKDFMEDAGNQAIGDVIKGTIPQLCSPFSAQVSVVLKTPGILLPVKKFGAASCTLDQVIDNIQGFYSDFRSGGWVAYQASWQPQNNFYGSLLLTIDAANIEASAQAEAAKNEANSSGGFLSEKRCDVEITNGADSETVTNQSEAQINQLRQNLEVGAILAVRNCQIITPGSFVGNLASKAVGSKVDAWIQADDIGPYLDVILNAAINKLTEEGTKGLLGLAANENPSGEYPTQGDFDTAMNDLADTIPPTQVLAAGEQCTTEDNPDTAENEGGQVGVYVTPPSGSSAVEDLICQPIGTTGGVNQLSPENITYRKEMVETYKKMLDNQRKIVLVKQKALHHMNSVVLFAQTIFPQIESCPANPSWQSDLWGAHVNTPGSDDDIRDIGRMYSERGFPSGEAGDPSMIEQVQKDIDKANAIILSLKNRLNQLQAPYDTFTAQNMGIPASQVGVYNTHLTNLVTLNGEQGINGAQLINNTASTHGNNPLIFGTANTSGANNAPANAAGYVPLLLNDTITVTYPGGIGGNLYPGGSGNTYTIPPLSPILVDQNDTVFTSSGEYAQFFSDTTLTNEVVSALWTSYQNFKLENWLISESVSATSPFFNKNIVDASYESYRPYFDLFTRNLYANTNANIGNNFATSSPNSVFGPGITTAYLMGGGLIGYIPESTTQLLGSNSDSNLIGARGVGLYTNCTGGPVFNQTGY